MPASSSRRCIHTGVGAAGSSPVTAQHDAVGAVGSATRTGCPRRRLGGDVERGRVPERHAVGRRRLAGDAAHRQAVAAVRRDSDVEHLVAQAEQRRPRRSGRCVRRRPAASTRMPGVVVADAELAARADHAVADVAVGLARGDGEAAGQHRAGQRDDDRVADGEVLRAADDPARLRPRPTSTLAPADRLAVAGGLAPRTSSTRPTTSGPSTSGPSGVDGLDLEAGGDQPSASSRAVTSAGRSTYSRSQDSGARIRSPCRRAG